MLSDRIPNCLMRGAAFWSVLIASFMATTGYSVLLSVVPLWVSVNGSGAFGAGVSTGIFMLTTVGTQLAVPWLMRRRSARTLFAVSLVLVGAPAPLLALSGQLAPVLVWSAVRGVGFGVFSVVSNALVAELAPVAEHGRATARYGLAVGIPQLVMVPGGVGLATHLGFTSVFVLAAAPLLGLVPLAFLRLPAKANGVSTARPSVAEAPITDRAPGSAHPESDPAPDARVVSRVFLGPLLTMVATSMAQGGLITFLPLTRFGAGGYVVPGALFGTVAGSVVGRLICGELVDRRGFGGRMLLPGMALAAVGMLVELCAVGFVADPTLAMSLLVASSVTVGVGFGLVQNDSLVSMFAAAGPRRYGTASAIWNIGYDAGTGAGAVGLGALAQPFGFPTAFGASAGLLLAASPLVRRGPRTRPARPS
ncbi:MAG TPA: MFS transporter [Pseudonocardia sp.]|nr:MFS transporter [Pseudonocardia sp.]